MCEMPYEWIAYAALANTFTQCMTTIEIYQSSQMPSFDISTNIFPNKDAVDSSSGPELDPSKYTCQSNTEHATRFSRKNDISSAIERDMFVVSQNNSPITDIVVFPMTHMSPSGFTRGYISSFDRDVNALSILGGCKYPYACTTVVPIGVPVNATSDMKQLIGVILADICKNPDLVPQYMKGSTLHNTDNGVRDSLAEDYIHPQLASNSEWTRWFHLTEQPDVYEHSPIHSLLHCTDPNFNISIIRCSNNDSLKVMVNGGCDVVSKHLWANMMHYTRKDGPCTVKTVFEKYSAHYINITALMHSLIIIDFVSFVFHYLLRRIINKLGDSDIPGFIEKVGRDKLVKNVDKWLIQSYKDNSVLVSKKPLCATTRFINCANLLKLNGRALVPSLETINFYNILGIRKGNTPICLYDRKTGHYSKMYFYDNVYILANSTVQTGPTPSLMVNCPIVSPASKIVSLCSINMGDVNGVASRTNLGGLPTMVEASNMFTLMSVLAHNRHSKEKTSPSGREDTHLDPFKKAIYKSSVVYDDPYQKTSCVNFVKPVLPLWLTPSSVSIIRTPQRVHGMAVDSLINFGYKNERTDRTSSTRNTSLPCVIISSCYLGYDTNKCDLLQMVRHCTNSDHRNLRSDMAVPFDAPAMGNIRTSLALNVGPVEPNYGMFQVTISPHTIPTSLVKDALFWCITKSITPNKGHIDLSLADFVKFLRSFPKYSEDISKYTESVPFKVRDLAFHDTCRPDISDAKAESTTDYYEQLMKKLPISLFAPHLMKSIDVNRLSLMLHFLSIDVESSPKKQNYTTSINL